MLELVIHYVKKDDNRHSEFMIAQKALNKEMMAMERLLSCSQARQSVLDSTISSGKRTVTGEMKLIESETLDSTIASFFYENALAFQCFGVAGAVRHTRMRASAARRLSQLVYAHEHSIIRYSAAWCCVPHRVPAPRAYAHKRSARGTVRRHAAHDVASARRAAQARNSRPVLG